MNKRVFCLASTLLLIASCGKSPQKARQELTKIGIEFTDKAFQEAVQKKDKIAIDLFLDAEHDASFVLTSAIGTYAKGKEQNIELIKELINNSSDPNIVHKMSTAFGDFYSSALDRAAYHENEEIVKLLLKKGADPNINDGEALKNALVYKKNLKIAKMLLKSGADINIKHQGNSLLYSAVMNNYSPVQEKGEKNIDVVKFMLDRGAKVNDGQNGESHPLIFAVHKSDPEMTELLLKNGANIDSTLIDEDDFASILLGRQPRRYTLHQIAEGNPEIIAILDRYSKQQKQAKK